MQKKKATKKKKMALRRLGTVMAPSIEDLKKLRASKLYLNTLLTQDKVADGTRRGANPSLQFGKEIKQSNDVDLQQVLSHDLAPTIPRGRVPSSKSFNSPT